jgi:hypothetical protein
MTSAEIGLALVVVLIVIIGLSAQLRVVAARRSGLLPAAGQSILSDVERLASKAEKNLGNPLLSRNSILRIGGG